MFDLSKIPFFSIFILTSCVHTYSTNPQSSTTSSSSSSSSTSTSAVTRHSQLLRQWQQAIRRKNIELEDLRIKNKVLEQRLDEVKNKCLFSSTFLPKKQLNAKSRQQAIGRVAQQDLISEREQNQTWVFPENAFTEGLEEQKKQVWKDEEDDSVNKDGKHHGI